MNRCKGMQAEELACNFLKRQGLLVITKNYYCCFGEIDLIMKDKELLDFVEVRQRQSLQYGGAISSITSAKKSKLLKTSQHYLKQSKLFNSVPYRFDLVSITGWDDNSLEWIKNAIYWE